MISEALVEAVRRRLASGRQSMRAIARATGVSRGTVANIARGRRRRQGGQAEDGSVLEPEGRLGRCPECGALTPIPCRACRVRRWVRCMSVPREEPDEADSLQIELTGESRRRYEEIHARRLREAWDD